MASLTPFFWSLKSSSYWLDARAQSPGSGAATDIVKCILLSMFAVVLAGKSVAILKLLRQRRSQGGNRDAGVYAITSLLLTALFVIGTILYCTKFLLALKKAMCAMGTWDQAPMSIGWIKCGGVIRNSYLHDTVDNVLGLVFALNAQIILSIVNGIFVYRVRKVFSDMWMVYVPVAALYVLWVVISFVEIYSTLKFDWSVPDHPRLFHLTTNELLHSLVALSFIFNLLVTVAIATRRFLQLRGKSTIPDGASFSLDNNKRPGYNKAMILLVDAALPVTLCSFVIVIAYSRAVRSPYSATASRVQGMFAIFWLVFNAMAPHLIAIHNLRAEAKEFAKKAEIFAVEKLRDSSLDMDVVAVKTLAYSKDEPAPV
ncbi:hypothetical protein EST38_g10367 [Candolleomyces aberdarensis]|uniref:Uncharacterized protein n=1 Tax=Candolleomyces aberdarensis TaxID=2316362 RepID=A0A4Q2D7K3_9AGAR|nr:hypothetical protein EST38_g10367 [Candolleomyces aberdarensis]